MEIIIFVLTTLFVKCFTEIETSDQVKTYLYKYGYLQAEEGYLQSLNETSISEALYIFQEFYKLPTDGKLNNDTRDLMLQPRCGNSDIISNFRTSAFKWNKPIVTWHYYLASQEVLELTRKAFSLWEEKSNIRFIHDRTNPDILISNKRLKHMMQDKSTQCTDQFDGKGGILAHAFYPDLMNSRQEIHIDEDENWSFLIDNVTSDQISLFSILVHEIGHAIGLAHSDVTDSIMFAYYNGKIEFSNDDVLAVQNLYGKPLNITPTLLPPSQPPQTEDDYPINANQIDLCDLKNINTLLIANTRLYILYDKWLWILDTNEMIYSNPLLITNWLTFLPKNFSKVIAVYQRPTGEVVMFIDSLVYMFDLTSLQLEYGYPKHISSLFGIQPNSLHTVFNSYLGKTYLFHNDNYFREINECSFTIKSYGYISDVFPGIPSRVDSSFRFTDGNLYFFKNNSVYLFNEFRGELVRTERNSLSVFGLKCINKDVLVQLKELISRLIVQNEIKKRNK